MLFRTVLTLCAATFALANPLFARQATNTNAQIGAVLDELSQEIRKEMFTISKFVSVCIKGTSNERPLCP